MRRSDPQTYDDFWSRMEAKKAVASQFKSNPKFAVEAWEATGMALEFAFKATIWKVRRLNRWPDSGELHTHDLEKLFRALGVDRNGLPPILRASLKTAFSWRAEHRYNRDRVPRKVAQDFYEAAFDDDGVVEWLKSL